jgi:N-acetyl-1-D-myo-inositol-2-amino-2-deoxy-alpha-D-glucopyranoside deacetylase
MTLSLLACFAHPDDESFGAGGVLARYSASGANVTLVCATLGEVGEISDSALATPENLGDVREQELRCAGAALGLTSVELLRYRDSGMAGTPDNEDPRAYVQAPADEVIGKLVRIIRRLRPQVVLTFDPGGAYGHPDHIAISHHTSAAVAAAGDVARYPEAGSPWSPARLFFTAIPRSGFARMRKRMEELGIDTSQFERPDMPIPGQPDEEIDAIVDVSDAMGAKNEAMRCHATQFGDDSFFAKLPKEVMDEFLSREHFTLAWGTPLPEGRPQTDLFAGLTTV